MQFDWYGATIGAGADEVVGALAGFGTVERCRPLYGYERAVEVRQGKELVAKALWGGVNGGEHVHVQASSDPTPEVVAVVRGEWPAHAVSRADACRDYSDPRAWRRLSKLAIGIAHDHGVKTRTLGDWIDGKDGRTLMVGAPTARVQVRVYEKGKQLGPLADPNRVRAEVQVRPQGAESKQALCVVPPERLWWSSQWSHAMAEGLGVDAIERLAIRPAWSPSSEENMRYWVAQQYGEGLKRWGNEVGWQNLASAIDELRARRKH